MARAQTSIFDAFARHFSKIEASIEQVVQGKHDIVALAAVCLIAEGHLLIEDVPGVGKTMLAKALARSLACTYRRIQFTPDLLPSDITGVRIWTSDKRGLEFKPGPIFANVVLGDEINRASPKTQAALLESMEELQVTLDGETYELERPFMVIATQNPIEHEGTYPLPEAELDRFLMRLRVGYPAPQAEVEILGLHGQPGRVEELKPVISANDVRKMIDIARSVHVADAIKAYIVGLLNATRDHPKIILGGSPRAGICLLRAGRALAASQGREYVLPDDVKTLALPVLAHRVIVSPETQMSGESSDDIVAEIVAAAPVPARARR